MKISYVTMNWPASSETFCVRDLMALQRSKKNVEVFGLKPQGKDTRELLENMGALSVRGKCLNLARFLSGSIRCFLHLRDLFGVVGEIWKDKVWKKRLKGFALLPSIFWCAGEIEKSNPDIVHLFWGHYPSLLALVLKKRKWPGVVSMFLGAYDLSEDFRPSLAAANQADVLFTHAKANLEYLSEKQFPVERFNIVHRGLDTRELERQSGGERKSRQIIVVSRLIAQKNIDKVIESFALIKSEFPDATLVIVGDGPESERLAALAKELNVDEFVDFAGYLPPAGVFRKLYESGVFLFLSTKPGERLPNAVKEAMYAGAIPIATFTPGMDELIEDGVDGFIIEDPSSERVLSSVRKLWSGMDDEAIASKARDKIQNHFSVDKSMEKYVEKWEQEVQGKS